MNMLLDAVRAVRWWAYFVIAFIGFVWLERAGMDVSNPASVTLCILGANAYWRLVAAIYIASLPVNQRGTSQHDFPLGINLFTGVTAFLAAYTYLNIAFFE